MEITRETDYAMRCVMHLARNPDRTIMVDEISREMEIPRSFLAKIVQKLTRAGIAESFRGTKGGFRLIRNSSQITMLDVIEAIEGVIALNRCAVEAKVCAFSPSCAVHPVWVKVREEFREVLARYSFQHLIDSTNPLHTEKGESAMYSHPCKGGENE